MGLLDRIVGTPKDRFAREVLRTVRSTGVAEAWYDAERFRIGFRRRREHPRNGATNGSGEGGGNGWVYLDNVYRECERADRAERDYRIAQLVESIVAIPDGPESWEQVQPHLRPVLRPATFGGGGPANAPIPISRPAWEFLREFVVIDRPKSMAYVTAANLESWAVDAEQVFAKARANLASIAALPSTPPPTGPVMMRFVETGDAYFVSRLLVYGWLASLASRVGGRPVAFVPDQNTLIVTDDQPDALGGVFDLVEEEYREAVRGISPLAYTVDDSGEVVPYEAPAGHPIAVRAHRAAAILAASEYSSQHGWLERDHEDVFVANLVVAQRNDGSVFTVASWTEGIDSLLPRADYIGFSGSDQDAFLVPWEAVAREVDLEPVAGLDPARFRLDAWPSPPVMDRLRAQAEKP
jgi:uncharacterized protein YtpQ (UPF0354 family)